MTDEMRAPTSAQPGFGTPDGSPPQGPLPPHHVSCMVCGTPAPGGYGLCAVRSGESVLAEPIFTDMHQGAPTLAHGGAVAAVADDLLGHAVRLVGVPAVTRRLEVDYLAPVVLGHPHRARAWVERVEGRKIWTHFELDGPSGRCATAVGLFVQVPVAHFLRDVGVKALPGGTGVMDSGGAAEAW